MRVSQHYGLPFTQPGLDFVDVDINGDTPVFVDPRALRSLDTPWGHECVSAIQQFFSEVLLQIKKGNGHRARALLRDLREPNETRLGFSKGASRGRGMGDHAAGDVAGALSKSAAAKSGLLVDLEDMILMVEGIGPDLVSDMVTNVIREHLIAYTQAVCGVYGIPLVQDVDSGPLWDTATLRWTRRFERLPMVSTGKLLLVPKTIVRARLGYDLNEYYRHFVLPYMEQVEIQAKSGLVELLRGEPHVTKKRLSEKYRLGKAVVAELTQKYPSILEEYRSAKVAEPSIPLDHEEFADVVGVERPDWDALLHAVVSVPTGNEHATEYHRAVASLMTALWHPDLVWPDIEYPIHEGRKRIDIRYSNGAQSGFFRWLSQHYSAQNIFVECKNYDFDPKNPEVDQLSGRFSRTRGQVGMLVFRKAKDKQRLLKRCHDTSRDDRGFIIALDDTDLSELVRLRKLRQKNGITRFLRARFDQLVN